MISVDFCGELYYPREEEVFTIGREADLVIDDDNAFLHRKFLQILKSGPLWWLLNVGSQLTATVANHDGGLQAWVSPGGALPIVMSNIIVWFTAGPTTYEFEILNEAANYKSAPVAQAKDGSVTVGAVELTPDQKLLIVALCENVLRRGERGGGSLPKSSEVAQRLGWALTKFNRKLDNVCEKLADLGIRGLHGGPTKLAISRRARLVEYALASRIVTAEDLSLLP